MDDDVLNEFINESREHLATIEADLLTIEEAGSNLLTRFGQIVYLFFMLTPPESLVERAWNRGLEVGRFKAIDDTLAHAVEAYSGMPELFFTWVRRMDKRVHFEFLDNTVPLGERPLTAAFGSNAILNVLDVRRLIDVRRYQRIDVNAREPAQIFPDPEQLAAERNLSFLRDCTVRFHEMNFAEQSSGRIYLQLRDGRPAWVDSEALERAVRDADTHAGLRAIAADAFEFPTPESTEPRWLRDVVDALPVHTLGRWGDARQPR